MWVFFDFWICFGYNISVIFLFIFIKMSKIKNLIAGWLAVLWSVVPWQAMNSTKVQSQQGETSTEIATIFDESKNPSTIYLSQNPEKYTWIYAGFETNPEGLDWQKIYNIDVADVPVEVLKYGMLRKMNEIRKTYWLKPLKYDKKLEKVAQDFADDERDYERWNNPSPHTDSKWKWVRWRFKESWLLWEYIEIIIVDGMEKWYWENMGSISWHTINSLYKDWMNSPWHKKQIISKYYNAVWFAINGKENVIVHDFWNVKKQ